MADLNKVTIRKKDIVARLCEHCGTKTLHVGKTGNTCLQCIADNELAGCCTIKQFNRWKDETGKVITEPRGAKL
jgi:hypothetical protein